jgi:hypothetical protein
MRFDTLAWAKKLEKAGVPSAHAEAQVEILSEVIEDNITTKQDLAEVRRDIILEIEKIKASLNAQQASRYAHEKFWPSCPQNLFASRDLY